MTSRRLSLSWQTGQADVVVMGDVSVCELVLQPASGELIRVRDKYHVWPLHKRWIHSHESAPASLLVRTTHRGLSCSLLFNDDLFELYYDRTMSKADASTRS